MGFTCPKPLGTSHTQICGLSALGPWHREGTYLREMLSLELCRERVLRANGTVTRTESSRSFLAIGSIREFMNHGDHVILSPASQVS